MRAASRGGGSCPWRALTKGTERSFRVTSGQPNRPLTCVLEKTPVRLSLYHDFPHVRVIQEGLERAISGQVP
jgi:hypothetical protein